MEECFEQSLEHANSRPQSQHLQEPQLIKHVTSVVTKQDTADGMRKRIEKQILNKINIFGQVDVQNLLVRFCETPTESRQLEDCKSVLPYFKLVTKFRELGVLDGDLLKWLMSVQLREFEPHNIIFQKGQQVDFFYVLLQGEVDLLAVNPKSKVLTLKLASQKKVLKSIIEQLNKARLDFGDGGTVNELNLKLLQVKQNTKETKLQLKLTPTEVHQNTIYPGQDFGEFCVERMLPRAGSCVARTQVATAVIPAELYIKTIKRIAQENQLIRLRFLRQIPYVRNWTSKQIQDFNSHLALEVIVAPNQLIIEEGKPADKVVVVKEGEFEIRKQNLKQVFMNADSGVIEMKLGTASVTSTKIFSDQFENAQEKQGTKPFYVGTELHLKIKTYLDTQVKHDESVAEYFRTDRNQQFFLSIPIGVIGPGQVFGDVDAYYSRPNTYSLIAKSPDAKLLVMKASTFKAQLDLNECKFARCTLQSDRRWTNKLAEAIHNYKRIQQSAIQNSKANLLQIIKNKKFNSNNYSASSKIQARSRILREHASQQEDIWQTQQDIIKHLADTQQQYCTEQRSSEVTTRGTLCQTSPTPQNRASTPLFIKQSTPLLAQTQNLSKMSPSHKQFTRESIAKSLAQVSRAKSAANRYNTPTPNQQLKQISRKSFPLRSVVRVASMFKINKQLNS